MLIPFVVVMEEKSIAFGDFDSKMKTDRSDYRKYFIHGLVLSVAMTAILPFLSLASNMVNSGFQYLSLLINFPLPSTPSSFITGILLVDIPIIGLFFLTWGFGTVDLVLTEKIWNKQQKKSWERRIAIGTLLLVCLLTYHIVTFAMPYLDTFGLAVFITLEFAVFPMVDGVIGLNVTTLQMD